MNMVCDMCLKELECIKIGQVMKINEGYDLVRFDLYECPSCGIRIRTGFGKPYPNPMRKK